MNLLFTLLIIVAFIVVVPLMLALFVRKDYRIQRELVINRSSDTIYDYIKHIKNQENYSKWVMTDPNMHKTYTGTDGTVGFIYAWNSQNKSAGKGEQEITALEPGKSIRIEIRFEKPFKGVGFTQQILDAASTSQTKITWSMHGKSVYPMNITNLFIDKILGSDIEKSLINLKRILETKL